MKSNATMMAVQKTHACKSYQSSMQSASLSYAAAACPRVPTAPNDRHVKEVKA